MHAGECARYITYHIQEVLGKKSFLHIFGESPIVNTLVVLTGMGMFSKYKRFKIRDDFNQKTFQVRAGMRGRVLALFLYSELISFIILIKVKKVTHTYFRVMNMYDNFITFEVLLNFQHSHIHVDQLLTFFFT